MGISEGEGPEKKDSDTDLAVPPGPRPKAKCRDKEEKSPPKPSDLSRLEKKDQKNMNKSARNNVKIKDEPELAALQLEGELGQNAKLMEEYKVAMQQIYNIFCTMIRCGNGTTDPENFKSERLHTAAEKLNREVVQTENFWKTDTKLQPAMNESIAKNSVILGAAERNLQENGPKHLKKLKKFLTSYWPRYVELKRELAKVIKQQKPDSQALRDECVKNISTSVNDKYLKLKNDHLGEIQCAFVELGFYHHACATSWCQIAERKVPKAGFQQEAFDFKQFFAPPPKP
uniref:BAR domain-containing protein n=1 Tax=Caenorhabditis tropicalis TaxID=1561998 RepID=A0A1I7TSM9_9PELO